jgi:hypothetical protein
MSTHWKLDFLMQCFNGPNITTHRQQHKDFMPVVLARRVDSRHGAFSRDTSSPLLLLSVYVRDCNIATQINGNVGEHSEQKSSTGTAISRHLYLG